MRKESLILIVAILAVVALTIGIPVFASGCSDGADCVGNGSGSGNCVGNGSGNCVGTCIDVEEQPFGDEPICF